MTHRLVLSKRWTTSFLRSSRLSLSVSALRILLLYFHIYIFFCSIYIYIYIVKETFRVGALLKYFFQNGRTEHKADCVLWETVVRSDAPTPLNLAIVPGFTKFICLCRETVYCHLNLLPSGVRVNGTRRMAPSQMPLDGRVAYVSRMKKRTSGQMDSIYLLRIKVPQS